MRFSYELRGALQLVGVPRHHSRLRLIRGRKGDEHPLILDCKTSTILESKIISDGSLEIEYANLVPSFPGLCGRDARPALIF